MPAARHERRRPIYFVIMVFLASAGGVWVHAADAGIPSNEDLRHVRAIAEPQVSPDGSRVLIRVTDATADGGRQHLWLVDVGANTTRQLTFSPTADKIGEHDARWLGDGGNIAFLAKRAEHVQLYRLPMSGGEAHAYDLSVAPVIDDSEEPDAIPPKKASDAPANKDPVPLDIEKYEPAPDGHAIAIIAHQKVGTKNAWGIAGTGEHPTGLGIVNLRTREMRIVGQVPMGNIGRSVWHVNGSSDGRWAVADDFQYRLWLIDRHTDEMIMLADLPYTVLRDAIIAHPTMSEGLSSLFMEVSTRSSGAHALRNENP